MSSPLPSAEPDASADPSTPTGDEPAPGRRRARRTAGRPGPEACWRGWAEIRADLKSSAGLVLALALTGLPLGLLWWLLSPRADFRITAQGPVVIGTPPEELLVADDGVFVLLVAVAGLLMGAAAWFLRRRRGVATVVALSVGAVLAAVIAWRLGEFLGSGPSAADLRDVGRRVTTALNLASMPALAVAPFTAIAAYLAAVMCSPGDDLGRIEPTRPVDEPPVDNQVPTLA